LSKGFINIAHTLPAAAVMYLSHAYWKTKAQY